MPGANDMRILIAHLYEVRLEAGSHQSAVFHDAARPVSHALNKLVGYGFDENSSPSAVTFQVCGIRKEQAVICTGLKKKTAAQRSKLMTYGAMQRRQRKPSTKRRAYSRCAIHRYVDARKGALETMAWYSGVSAVRMARCGCILEVHCWCDG